MARTAHTHYHQGVHPHHPGKLIKGVIYLLLAWLMLTTVTTLSRYVSKTETIPTMLFFQKLISMLCVLPWVIKQGSVGLKTQRFGLIFFRAIVGLLSFGFLFAAVRYTTIVDAILLDNTAPFLIPFLVWIWIKTPINHKLWPAILIGFAGIVCILKPGISALNIGALFALAAALMDAMMMVSLRLLTSTEKTATINFYYFLIGGLVCMPFAIWQWRTPTLTILLMLVAMGVLSAIGQFAFTNAFLNAKPHFLGPFNYIAVVYSGIFEWALFGQLPDIYSLAGVVLICAGGIWMFRFSSYPLIK